MNKEEKEVLKTFKSGLGLTSAEREILANYIDKLQKENEKLRKQVDIEFVEENYIEKSKVISKYKIRDIKRQADKDHCYQYLVFYEEVCKLLGE